MAVVNGVNGVNGVPANGMLGGNTQLIDYMMANMFYSKFADMFKDGINLTPMLLVKLLLLLMINEFKPHLSNIIGSVITGLKMLPYDRLMVMMPPLMGLLRRVRLSRKPKEISYVSAALVKQRYREIINIKAEPNFLMALYSYIRRKHTREFQRSLSCVTIKNAKEHIFKEILQNFAVQYDNVQIEIDNDLVYSINTVNDNIVEVEINGNKCADNPNRKITTVTDLLPDQLGKMIKKITDDYTGCGVANSRVDRESIVRSLRHKTPNYYSESTMVDMLRTNYPDIDADRGTIEFAMLNKLLAYYAAGFNTNYYDEALIKRGILLLDPTNTYEHPGLSPGMCYGYINWQSNYFLHTYEPLYGSNEMHKIATDWWKSIQTITNSDSNNDSSNSKVKEVLTVSMESEFPFDVSSIIKGFIDEVYTYSKRPDQTVKIFTIHLQTVVTSTEVPNPEYATWEEKKQLFKDASSNGQGPNIPDKASLNDLRIQLLAEKIPTKTVTQTTSEKKIIIKQLNEITKDIDTLYLRKRDKEMLINNLMQFRDKKEVFRTFGFQNKLNVLLYGEPGTGKSTTIQAIATYLNKDIYYLDLKEVTTNAELQMMFEYVNKNVPGSGIVVLEDIDCMTDVVLRRQDISDRSSRGEASVHQLISDQDNKLSLEYFLNVLQGTLTIDGSIFLVTTNHIHHLDPAFVRPGRFDMMVELKLCDAFQIDAIYTKMIGRSIPPNILNRIAENRFTPAKVLYTLKNFIFMTHLDDSEILDEFLSK